MLAEKGLKLGEFALAPICFFFHSPEQCSKGCQADNDPLKSLCVISVSYRQSCHSQRHETLCENGASLVSAGTSRVTDSDS